MTLGFDIMALTVLLPLLGALLLGSVGDRFSKTLTATIACGTVGASFAIVLYTAYGMLRGTTQAVRSVDFWEWATFTFGGSNVAVGFGIYLDPLSLTLMSVVTGVGFLIHWYSSEYMADDPNYSRYFALLNLFVAAMSLLVLANNLPVLIIGWGGVGLASFALIGFYREKPSAAAAAKKAFVMNVIGDVGLMIAVFVIFLHTQTLDYHTLFQIEAPKLSIDPTNEAWLITALLGLMVGAYAKSAQLPLHTWLPDAMEGPTPVSALIHAATMVTAGVYLLVRFAPLLEQSPVVMQAIAYLGLLSALMAACWALMQTDLKRVLAYSTMSQLGYMFLAVGVGAYGAAIFHLVTHAFFKALLFLTAGIVIHAAHGEQDMRKLGGLGKSIPYTALLFAVGGAALAGLPLTSGFFSKEAILHSAHGDHGSTLLFLGGAGIAILTAFYTGRAFFLTFFGPEAVKNPHLPGAATTLSCTVLAGLALVGGYPYQSLAGFLNAPEASATVSTNFAIDPGASSPAAIGLGVLCLLALAAAYAVFGKSRSDKFADPGLQRFRDGSPFDNLLYPLVSAAFVTVGRFFARDLDRVLQDKVPNTIGRAFIGLGQALKELQSGQVRHYMASVVITVVILLFYALMIKSGGTL